MGINFNTRVAVECSESKAQMLQKVAGIIFNIRTGRAAGGGGGKNESLPGGMGDSRKNWGYIETHSSF